MNAYLGIDLGSVTTKVVALDDTNRILASRYIRTQGRPIEAVQQGLAEVARALQPMPARISGLGTTGSGRYLAAVVGGADVIKNEITAHAVATSYYLPEVQTIMEIGGQDSKIIILRDGVAVDFGMNTVCAAGTGAFLDQQAARLNIGVESIGALALKSRIPVRIAGRCTVFAESDMIHKQQMGHRVEDILYGLCQAMARNYLNNVGLGKTIRGQVAFQGGVASNEGMVRAFEEALQVSVQIPPHHQVIGAIGAAMLARESMQLSKRVSYFRGFEAVQMDYRTTSFECRFCTNRCEVVQVSVRKRPVARWGGRCDRWDVMSTTSAGYLAPAGASSGPGFNCEMC